MGCLSPKPRKLLAVMVLAAFILAALVISGFTVTTLDHSAGYSLPPAEGPVAPGAGGEGGEEGAGIQAAAEPVNVIVNGDFEQEWDPLNGVAPGWEPYSNGQAEFGWYDEQWAEAVRSGKHAQLMEIFHVEANVQSRVIAIHQTVDVAPNSTYNLEFYAIMRTQAPPTDRNRHEFEMHWGVDFSGEGDYDNVGEWHLIPLEEQFRLGSAGQFPDDVPLAYEVVTGTVETGESNRITLFIRGMKKFSTGTEVNFDVDDVSLVGPPPGTQPAAPEAPAEGGSMPDTGVTLPGNVSAGALALGGLVLVVLGVTAAAGLLHHRKGH